jgi:hypothetical protein
VANRRRWFQVKSLMQHEAHHEGPWTTHAQADSKIAGILNAHASTGAETRLSVSEGTTCGELAMKT